MKFEMVKTMNLAVHRLCMTGLVLTLVACGGQQAAVKPNTNQVAEIANPGLTTETSGENNSPVLIDPSPERLVLAARYGQKDSLTYFLNGGMDVNARDAYGNTAMIAAASNGQREIVELLLQRGANLNNANKERLTALMGAATQGDYELAHLLIWNGARVNPVNSDGETALFLAVKYGHYKAAKVLLKGGASPNMQNKLPPNLSNSGYTPLMYAASHGLGDSSVNWIEMAQLLLNNGANPNLVNSHGDAALHLAQAKSDEDMMTVLRQSGAKDEKIYAGLNMDESLLKSAEIGDVVKIKQLLPNGANPNFMDKNGITPLLAAAYQGQFKALQLLVQADAEINFIPSGLRQFALSKSHAPLKERELMEAASRGDTALIAAVRRGYYDIASYLLDARASIDLSNRHGEASLFVAVAEGNLEMVRLLLEHGGNVNSVEQDNRRNVLALVKYTMGKDSLLMAAIQQDQDEIVRLLVEKGANVNYRGNMGKTALFTAVETGNQALVSYLLENNADANIVTLAGISPLMEASRMGSHLMVADLLASEANVNVIERPELGYASEIQDAGSTGMTALMFAVRGGHKRVVEQLLQAGAETKIHNSDGENAVSIAGNHGYNEIIQLLSLETNTDSVVLSVVKE